MLIKIYDQGVPKDCECNNNVEIVNTKITLLCNVTSRTASNFEYYKLFVHQAKAIN